MRTFQGSQKAQVRPLVSKGCQTGLTTDREVPGHKSTLAFGLLGSGEGVPVVAMLGRVRDPFELGLIHEF
jgi:hypothetical protein